MDLNAALNRRLVAVASAPVSTAPWITDPELPRRIAAAIAFAGRAPKDVAPELNISARTLERVIAGTRQPREWEVQRLADILDVPLWFLAEGFAGAERPSEDDRLSELQRSIDALLEGLSQVDEFTRAADALGAALRERPAVAAEDRPSVPRPGEGPDVPR